MLPGVGHCRGGVGPDQADWIGTLAGWVEKNKPPASIESRREDQGKGETNDAKNFECAAAR